MERDEFFTKLQELCKNSHANKSLPRNVEIFLELLDGKARSKIAKEYGFSPSNVTTIAMKVARRIRYLVWFVKSGDYAQIANTYSIEACREQKEVFLSNLHLMVEHYAK